MLFLVVNEGSVAIIRMSIQTNVSTHLIFILETIEYLVSRLDELYRSQQELHSRKKSIIKIYDKNIDRLPAFPNQLPLPPNLEALLDQLHRHRVAISTGAQLWEKQRGGEQGGKGKELEMFMVREVKEMDLRMLAVEEEVRSLSCDVGELILLYKESILA